MSGVFLRCAAGLVLFVAERYPVVRKSSSTEQTRDKVRRRFTLSVTAESWWDDRAGGHRLWLWGWTWLLSSTASHLNKDNVHDCSDRKLIKCLTDSADDLSSLLACTHYLYMGLRCGPSALWPRSRALQTPAVPRPAPGLDRRTPVVGGGSATPASHAPRRSTKDKGPKFLCT